MIDGDTADQIANDVALEIPVHKSKLNYDPEMATFRAGVQERFDAMKKVEPKTMMVVPN